MKRLMFVVLAALLVAPAVVQAQAVPSIVDTVLVPADEIGEGWTITYEGESSGYPSPWDRQIIYGGPEGARVTVWLLGLGAGLEWVSGSWGRLTEFWIAEATKLTGVDDPETASILAMGDRERDIKTDLMVDTKAIETDGPIVIGVSQFGAYDLQIGLLIVAEGTVNGLTGVAATDYVAGLYFAALSGQ